MDQTINLPSLITKISADTQVSPAEIRRFLHELFESIESRLLQGEVVAIDGIGQFVRGDDASRPVMFRPDSRLAAQINEPFSAFEAVELFDGAENDIVSKPEPMVKIDIDDAPIYIPEPKDAEDTKLMPSEWVNEEIFDNDPEIPAEPIEETIATIEPPEEPIPFEINEPMEPDEVSVDDSTPVSYQVPDIPEDGDDDDDEAEKVSQPIEPVVANHVHSESKHLLWLVIGILIGLILGMCGGYFAGKYMGAYTLPEDFEYPEILPDEGESGEDISEESTIQITAPETESQSVEQQSAETSEAPSVAPVAKAEPVYDTVTKSRYLATIAKEHYGVKNYWVFIYDANPELGNPNRIAPGTRLLIPERSTFEEATPEATAAKASRRLAELGKKYKF